MSKRVGSPTTARRKQAEDQRKRQTFETVYPEIHREWLSSRKADTHEPQDALLIRLLCERGKQEFAKGSPDGVRLAHRLVLEAARCALALVAPDQTGLLHQPLHDLQWTLADLELGCVRSCLNPPIHMQGRGNKPDSFEILVFKRICLEAARLYHAAGYSPLKADATVINRIAHVGERLGVRMKRIRVSTFGEPIRNGDGKRINTTLDGWRKAHRDRRQLAVAGKRMLHVTMDFDPAVAPQGPNPTKQAKKLANELLNYIATTYGPLLS